MNSSDCPEKNWHYQVPCGTILEESGDKEGDMPCARVAGLGLGLAITLSSGADIFLDQPVDFRGFSPSEENTAIPSARTAGDYWYNGGFQQILVSVHVWMVVTFPNTPDSFALQLYRGRTRPETLQKSFVASAITDLGEWKGRDDLHLIEVEFELNTFMGRGRGWLSPCAIGNTSGTDRAWWATSGDGDIRQKEGHFISEHFGVPEWTPISESGILDFPTDFAMRIEATIPAPGATAVIALAGLATRRRRD